MKLSVVIPCYNESRNIPIILSKFEEVINRDDIEVVLVNNGSTDNSAEVFKQLLPDYPFAKLVTVANNQGYGYGITEGLKAASGEFIGYTHADLQTDPADVIKALNICESESSPENCYVKGDRKNRPFMDQFFTSGMSLFETLYMGVKLSDINAQPNIFHRSFFEELKSKFPKDFSLDLFFLYHAVKKGKKVIRFDVVFPPRVHGESSWNTGLKAKWKFIKRTVDFSIKLKNSDLIKY